MRCFELCLRRQEMRHVDGDEFIVDLVDHNKASCERISFKVYQFSSWSMSPRL